MIKDNFLYFSKQFYMKRPRGRAVSTPDLDQRVTGSNPAGGEILSEPKRHFIAQSLSSSPFHRPEMTEILLKGCKTVTHPSNNSMLWVLIRIASSLLSQPTTYVFIEKYGKLSLNYHQIPTLSVSLFLHDELSCLVTKPTKWHMHPAKTQIGLGIRPV